MNLTRIIPHGLLILCVLLLLTFLLTRESDEMTAQGPVAGVENLVGVGQSGDIDPAVARIFYQPDEDLPLPLSRLADSPSLSSAALGELWTGDLDTMAERRVIRVLVVYSRTFYFLDGVVQRGLAYDAMKEFEIFVNRKLKTKTLKLRMMFIPVATEQLIPALLAGAGDIVVANLTDISSRRQVVDFSTPLMTDVQEIVVSGPKSPVISSLDDLSGQKVYVRQSSSYYESLQKLNKKFLEQGVAPAVLVRVNRYLEDEDLLEMVNAGIIPLIVVDSHIASVWKDALDKLVLHEHVVLRQSGSMAWAMRKNSPRLKQTVDQFLARHRKGTLFGNIVFRRYLQSDRYVKNPLSVEDVPQLQQAIAYFKKYAQRYDFDWPMIAAQAYQESHIDQSKRSHVGAVGVMQILPSTAADKNVAIKGLGRLENNIHAGVKYLRFITDRYLKDEELDDFNRALLAFAAYNVGPARLGRLRREAKAAGLDPNVWFDNVEIIAAKRVGREPVQYVSNILKYWVTYELLLQQKSLTT